ncbi:MAG TPA: RluA family pseudouridine synthase [Rhodospirillales bacterium]|nr:RluA family pseudouridine synthase [Rhodospirillales bacterium]
MSGVRTEEIAAEDAGLRLDRWFKRRFPELSHARLQKLLRTGQVRVDGKRIKAGARLEAGQRLRIPPLGDSNKTKQRVREVSAADAEALVSRILHRDARVIVIDKPPGLAVQGGTATLRHLDGMLDALRFDSKERPRLVHRLDKDTSGVLALARDAAAAAKLTAAFRAKTVRKLYWAAVAGAPKPPQGRISLALAKSPGPKGERMVANAAKGKAAETLYKVLDKASKKAAWLALEPLTGRTHQLRAHCAALGTPILGDGKYGGAGAFLVDAGLPRKLHLHARAIRIPHPDGGLLEAVAPLPEHILETWRRLGFENGGSDKSDPFEVFNDFFHM